MLFSDITQNRQAAPVVFLHIPRTGGSTAWHYLTEHCAHLYHLLDLAHEAKTRLGHERFALTAAAMFIGDMHRQSLPTLIHHHGTAPINAIFPRATYCTLLRDPVERLQSYHTHIQQMQARGVDTGEIDVEGMTVRDFAMSSPWIGRQYCLWFGALLWQEAGLYPRDKLLDFNTHLPELDEALATDTERLVNEIVGFISRTFFYVGFFDELSRATKRLVRVLGGRQDLPGLGHMNTHEKGRSALSEAELSALREACEPDYLLYRKVRSLVAPD